MVKGCQKSIRKRHKNSFDVIVLFEQHHLEFRIRMQLNFVLEFGVWMGIIRWIFPLDIHWKATASPF